MCAKHDAGVLHAPLLTRFDMRPSNSNRQNVYFVKHVGTMFLLCAIHVFVFSSELTARVCVIVLCFYCLICTQFRRCCCKRPAELDSTQKPSVEFSSLQ